MATIRFKTFEEARKAGIKGLPESPRPEYKHVDAYARPPREPDHDRNWYPRMMAEIEERDRKVAQERKRAQDRVDWLAQRRNEERVRLQLMKENRPWNILLRFLRLRRLR